MNGNNFKFINTTPYAPEQYNIVDENNKLIAYIRTRWGEINVYPYINNEIDFNNSIFHIKFDDEYLGAIPDNMKDDIFDSITSKLNQYLNDIK